MMYEPCQLGLKCPYLCYDIEDGDLCCSYPKLAKNLKEGTPVSLVYDVSCELMDIDSDLSLLLETYANKEEIFKEHIKETIVEHEKWWEEWKKHREENERRRQEYEAQHGRLEI